MIGHGGGVNLSHTTQEREVSSGQSKCSHKWLPRTGEI